MSTVTTLYQLYKAMENDEREIVIKGQAMQDLGKLQSFKDNGLLNLAVGGGAAALGNLALGGIALASPLFPIVLLGAGVAAIGGIVGGIKGANKDKILKKEAEDLKKRNSNIDFNKFFKYMGFYKAGNTGNSYVTLVHK